MNTQEVKIRRRDLQRFSGVRRTGRFLGSWASLMAGLGLCYTALHYIPSFLDREVILADSATSASGALDVGSGNPFYQLFKLERGYFRTGQAVVAQYELQPGASVDLIITRCRNTPVVEVYRCDPVSSSVIGVSDRSGARTFTLSGAGFYMLNERATGDYRVVWKRA